MHGVRSTFREEAWSIVRQKQCDMIFINLLDEVRVTRATSVSIIALPLNIDSTAKYSYIPSTYSAHLLFPQTHGHLDLCSAQIFSLESNTSQSFTIQTMTENIRDFIIRVTGYVHFFHPAFSIRATGYRYIFHSAFIIRALIRWS